MKNTTFVALVLLVTTCALGQNAKRAALSPVDSGSLKEGECQQKTANDLQKRMRKQFPKIQVWAMKDMLVLSDPAFGTAGGRAASRAALHRQGTDALCVLGFKKVRTESTEKPSIGEELDLTCPNANEFDKQVYAIPGLPLSFPSRSDESAPNGDGGNSGKAERPVSSSEITGKIFLITRGGDLKPARLAQVILLLGGPDEGTAAYTYFNSKNLKMKELYQSLVSPDDAISCNAELLVFNEALSSVLTWGESSGKRGQIRIVDADEEGAFSFPTVAPGEYELLAWGHAGANKAYWEQTVTTTPSELATLKVGSPHTACLDY